MCIIVIEQAWSTHVRGNPPMTICKKMTITTRRLKFWNKNYFGCCHENIKNLEERLSARKNSNSNLSNLEWNCIFTERIGRITKETWITLQKKKSRKIRLPDEDKNFKYVHLSTLFIRRQNQMNYIQNDDGVWLTGR